MGFIVGVVVGLFKMSYNKEGYTNNGLDIYNNLAFSGDRGGLAGARLDVNGYDDGVAEKWGYGWGDNIVKQFLELQSTINPDYIFNVNMLQKIYKASP